MTSIQLISDCPECLVEGGLLELADPSGKLTVAIEGRCRLCGHATELGEVRVQGARFSTVDDVVHALAEWSTADGEPDVLMFTQVNMGGLTPAEVARRVLRRERVETSFDVIAFLFPSSGNGFQPDESQRRPEVRLVNEVTPLPAVQPEPIWNAPPFGPLDVARALVSVMVADGVVRPSEKQFLARMLAEWRAPALPESEYRVWRPQEMGTPPDPQRLFDVMRLMCLVDREADGTEVRILQEYARAWGLKLDLRDLDRPSAIRGLVNAVVRLFVA